MKPHLICLGVLLSVPLAPPAFADDAADCAGTEPARIVSACTRIIGTANAPAPQVASAYTKRGVLFALQGQYDKALADLAEAIRLDPKGAAEGHHARGRIYGDQGRPNEAIAEFEAALKADPKHVDALISRGSMRVMAARGADGKFNKRAVDAGMTDLAKAIEIAPQYADAYVARGGIYLVTNRLAQAVADFDQAIKLDPKAADAYIQRGVASVFQRQFDKASADFGQAAKLDPDNPVVYKERAASYLLQGKNAEALADAERALQRAPNYADALALRAQARKRLGVAQ